jgi:Acyl-CoA hydrolase
VPIPETNLKKTLLMHTQDINMHGKIFGRFIMKEATELAWLASYLHGSGKGYPEFLGMDDFVFLNPVEVGSVALFECKWNSNFL